jgi:hypothetical protein
MTVTFPQRMVISRTGGLFNLNMNFRKKKQKKTYRAYHSNAIYPIPLIRFFQPWRVFFVQNEYQSPNPNDISW